MKKVKKAHKTTYGALVSGSLLGAESKSKAQTKLKGNKSKEINDPTNR